MEVLIHLRGGDFNNDGHPDIVFTGWTPDGLGRLILFRNDGEGHFVESNGGVSETQGNHVEWGDFDSDGDLDFLVAGGNFTTDYSLYIHRNDGEGRFSMQSIAFTNLYATMAKWVDLENDGRFEIIALPPWTSSAVIPHLLREINCTFQDAGQLGISCYTKGAGIGDADNDGFSDLTIFGWNATGNGQPTLFCPLWDLNGSLMDGNVSFLTIQTK